MAKWLDFRLRPRATGRNTDQYEVWSKEGSYLGQISWYAPWRQYSFYPAHGNLVFERNMPS